jgi:hypothetical protein
MRVEPLESRIAPAPIIVSTLSDIPVAGRQTLRQAIAAANMAGGGVITFSPGLHGTIKLTGGSSIPITSAVTIDGLGYTIPMNADHNRITISGGNKQEIMDIAGTGDVTINNLNFTGGNIVGGGAAIYDRNSGGELTITGCSFIRNESAGQAGVDGTSAKGGAIFIEEGGGLTLSFSKFSGNLAVGGAGTYGGGSSSGGALYIEQGAAAQLDSDLFASNSAIGGSGFKGSKYGGTAYGGAIYAGGAVTIQNSTFSGNIALGGKASGNNLEIDSNVGSGRGLGGAIYCGPNSNVYLYHGILGHNSAKGGSGLAGPNGIAGAAGQPGSEGGPGGSGGYAIGGGISTKGYLKLVSCTLSGNSAIGGNGGSGGTGGHGGAAAGAVKAGAGGNGGEGGFGGFAVGGGVSQFSSGSLILISSTVSGDVAVGGPGGKGGLPGAGGKSTPPPHRGFSGPDPESIGGGVVSYEAHTLTVSYDTISKNFADDGGGLDISDPTSATIQNSTISSNHAFKTGGIAIEGKADGTPVVIMNSTISSNVGINDAGGVAVDTVPVHFEQVTIAKNSGDAGGGIFVYGLGTTIDNSTIAFNKAFTHGGGVYSYSGSNVKSIVSFDSTVVSNNTVPTGILGADVYGNVSATHSAFGSSAGFTISSSANPNPLDNIMDMNFFLQTLKNNGGPTQTILFSKASPLLNTGDNPDNQKDDQRGDGFLRLDGAAVDIGSVEVG